MNAQPASLGELHADAMVAAGSVVTAEHRLTSVHVGTLAGWSGVCVTDASSI